MKSRIVAISSAALFFFTASAHAKCFPWKVAEIAYSTGTHRAKVVSISPTDRAFCDMALKVGSVDISGHSSSARFCRARKDATLLVKLEPHCCDEPPCEKGMKNEIVFIDPELEALETKEDCPGETKVVRWLIGIPSREMVEMARRGEGVIASTDIGSPKDKAIVCLSDRSYRWEKSSRWTPLPEDWGKAAK